MWQTEKNIFNIYFQTVKTLITKLHRIFMLSTVFELLEEQHFDIDDKFD